MFVWKIQYIYIRNHHFHMFSGSRVGLPDGPNLKKHFHHCILKGQLSSTTRRNKTIVCKKLWQIATTHGDPFCNSQKGVVGTAGQLDPDCQSTRLMMFPWAWSWASVAIGLPQLQLEQPQVIDRAWWEIKRDFMLQIIWRQKQMKRGPLDL